MADRLPDEVSAARKHARDSGLDHTVIDRLTERVIEYAGRCRRLLDGAWEKTQPQRADDPIRS
jgi:hypothetical protein